MDKLHAKMQEAAKKADGVDGRRYNKRSVSKTQREIRAIQKAERILGNKRRSKKGLFRGIYDQEDMDFSRESREKEESERQESERLKSVDFKDSEDSKESEESRDSKESGDSGDSGDSEYTNNFLRPMSVNRGSDLNTSLTRTDGVHNKFLNLTSSDRNKNVYPDSADSEIGFDEQSNVIGIQILNFEIPHTRYAIDLTNNALYMSEKWADDVYFFYALLASTGGYTIQNLSVSMELSTRCPVLYNGDRDMGNSYNFVTAGVFGKVGIISSGDYEYSIHNATETVTLEDFSLLSDTEAVITFLASTDYLFSPGALMLLKLYTYYDREVQILETTSDRTVRVIGDFSDVVSDTLDVVRSTMKPYSATNSVSRIMGLGSKDLTGESGFQILSMGSPFSGEVEGDYSSVMVVVNFPLFVSPGDHVEMTGMTGFMNGMVFEVSEVHDDTHIGISVEKASLWSNTDGTIANSLDPSLTYDVDSINLVSVDNNDIVLSISPSTSTTFGPGDTLALSGFSAPELESTVVTVDSASASSNDITVSFTYPTTYLLSSGLGFLAPCNIETGLRTTYVTPYRFDLSRGRRMILCKAIIDNQDVGSIHIPSLSASNFFGRIQLFSGADLVNFLGPDTAVGSHEFNSVLKRLNKIRFQFFNDDGTAYDFVGVDYTIFLKLVCLDSNTGI